MTETNSRFKNVFKLLIYKHLNFTIMTKEELKKASKDFQIEYLATKLYFDFLRSPLIGIYSVQHIIEELSEAYSREYEVDENTENEYLKEFKVLFLELKRDVVEAVEQITMV